MILNVAAYLSITDLSFPKFGLVEMCSTYDVWVII